MIEITVDDIVIIISRNKPSAEDRRKESLRFWTLANTIEMLIYFAWRVTVSGILDM